MKRTVPFVLCLLTSATAQSATIHVDGTTCALADAVVAANSDTPTGGCPMGDAGVDVLVLDADVTLAGADPSSTPHDGVGAGLPDITDDLTITAGLGSVIRRDPTFTCDVTTVDPVFRFFNLESGSLTLDGLSLENGCYVAADVGNEGGGIRAAASTELTLTDVDVGPFGAFSTSGSLDGGFLFIEGDRLTVTGGSFDAVVVEAAASMQGGVMHLRGPVVSSIHGTTFSHIDSTTTTSSMQGGVLYASGGVTTLEDVTFEDVAIENVTSLQGGAVYRSSAGTLVVRQSSFRRFDIQSRSGASLQGGGLYAASDRILVDQVTFSDLDIFAGGGCSGGALFSTRDGPYEGLIVERVRCTSDREVAGAAAAFFASGVVLRDCVFRDNEGLAVTASRGGAVVGNDFAMIERCAFVANRLAPALSVAATAMEGGGLHAGGIGRLRNVTFADNVLEGGSGISAGQDGGAVSGGGLYLGPGGSTSRLSAVTFTENRLIGGEGGAGFQDGQALGGGLYVGTGHAAEIIGSILSDNTVAAGQGSVIGEDCFADGTLTSLGFNLVEAPDSSCPVTAFGDIIGIDPGLYPIADYGCAAPLVDGSCVPTAAIDHTSWAVDWSHCGETGVGDDARRLDRRQDIAGVVNLTADACDVGAFEARDQDGDGITDVPDLCPHDADPDQSDADGDLVGDACDVCEGDDATGDGDGDRVCDDSDSCSGFDDGVDADGDGIADGCDVCVGDDATGDADGDLLCDDTDVCAGFDDAVDGDGDGVPDGCDVCAGDDASGDDDGDGVCDDEDASLGDRVWLDDGNGIRDGGEPGVAGVTVRLFSADAVLIESTLTDANGGYGFSPGPGAYYVEVVLPIDMAYAPRDQGADDQVDSDIAAGTGTTSVFTLAAGASDVSRDAGLEPAVIGNRVWLDADGDGLQGSDEVGVVGVVVRLLSADGTEIATTTTRHDGTYGFLGVATGDYRIEIVPPTGHRLSIADVGGDDRLDSDIDPVSGKGPLFTYVAASATQRWDAGLRAAMLFTDDFESGVLAAWTERVP